MDTLPRCRPISFEPVWRTDVGRSKLSLMASFCAQHCDHCVLSVPGWPWGCLTAALIDSSYRGLASSCHKPFSGTASLTEDVSHQMEAMVPVVGKGRGPGVIEMGSVFVAGNSRCPRTQGDVQRFPSVWLLPVRH